MRQIFGAGIGDVSKRSAIAVAIFFSVWPNQSSASLMICPRHRRVSSSVCDLFAGGHVVHPQNNKFIKVESDVYTAMSDDQCDM